MFDQLKPTFLCSFEFFLAIGLIEINEVALLATIPKKDLLCFIHEFAQWGKDIYSCTEQNINQFIDEYYILTT